MSARVPSGFFETTMHFQLPFSDGDIVTSLGWDGADAAAPPNFSDVNDALEDLMGNISVGCTWVSTTFNLGSGATDNPVHEEPAGLAGLSSGTPAPANVALLVQKRTALGGRRERGRNYFPGLTASAIDNASHVVSATLTGLQTNWDSMVTDMAALTYTPVLFHQTAPFTPTPVVSFEVQPLLATQRTRMRG